MLTKRIPACAIIFGLLVCGATSAKGQEVLELVETLGGKLTDRVYAENYLQELKWQVRVNEKQMDIIREIANRWQAEYDMGSAREDAVRKKLREHGVDGPVSAAALRDLEVQVVDFRARIEGLRSKTRQLETELEVTRKSSLKEASSLDTELRSAQIKLELAQEEFMRTKKLAEQRAKSKQELTRAKYTVAIAELGLQKVADQIERVKTGPAFEIQAHLSATLTEMSMLERQLAELMLRRVKLADAQKQLDGDLAKFRRQLALKMIEQSQTRLVDLELDNTRNLALIAMIQQDLGEPSDSGKSEK